MGYDLLRHISLTKTEQQASQTARVNEENTHEARLSLYLFTLHLLVDLVGGFKLVCQCAFQTLARSCWSHAVHVKWPILVFFKECAVMPSRVGSVPVCTSSQTFALCSLT